MKGPTDGDRLVTVELARLLLDRILVAEPEQAGARRLFEAQSRAYLAHPRRFLRGPRRRNGPLAFGPTEIEQLLNPVLIGAASEVLGYLAGEALLRGGAMSVRGVRRLFGAGTRPVALSDAPALPAGAPGAVGPGAATAGGAGPEPLGDNQTEPDDPGLDGAPDGADRVPPLTIQQWARVREIMTESLIRHGNLPREWADRLAVAAVGEGVLAEPPA